MLLMTPMLLAMLSLSLGIMHPLVDHLEGFAMVNLLIDQIYRKSILNLSNRNLSDIIPCN
jgi:hypothetical protein